jgi:hypothetical protein
VSADRILVSLLRFNDFSALDFAVVMFEDTSSGFSNTDMIFHLTSISRTEGSLDITDSVAQAGSEAS